MNKPRQAKTTNIDEQPKKKKKRQTNQKNQTQKLKPTTNKLPQQIQTQKTQPYDWNAEIINRTQEN